MDPSAAADEKRRDDLDQILSALQQHMDSLMTLARDAAALANGDSGKPVSGRKRTKRLGDGGG